MFVVPSGGKGGVSQEGSLANILGQEKVKFLLVYVILTGIQHFTVTSYSFEIILFPQCSGNTL